MKDTAYVYAIGKIRALENSLITTAQMDAVIAATDYATALRMFGEMGMTDIDSENEESVLGRRFMDTFDLICSIAPSKEELSFLLVKNDFHNMKALLKALVTDTDPSPYLISPSIIDPEKLKSALADKQFSTLPEFAAAPFQEGYRVLTETMDGQEMDILLDRAALDATVRLASACGDAYCIALADRLVTLTDLKIALRGVRTGKDRRFFETALAECGGLRRDSLIEAALDGEEALLEYVGSIGFATLPQTVGCSFSSFERAADDLLMDTVRGAKYQSFGIAPLIGYYLARESEVKSARIILSGKRNGLPEAAIRERVRKLYV